MPVMILACEMCPMKVEATFYSFIMAIINLGYLISYDVGGLLMDALGITATNYSGLSTLVIITSIFPLFSLPIVWCILPSQLKMKE